MLDGAQRQRFDLALPTSPMVLKLLKYAELSRTGPLQVPEAFDYAWFPVGPSSLAQIAVSQLGSRKEYLYVIIVFCFNFENTFDTNNT